MKVLGSRAGIKVLANSYGLKMIKGFIIKASGKKATSTVGARCTLKTAGLLKGNGDRVSI